MRLSTLPRVLAAALCAGSPVWLPARTGAADQLIQIPTADRVPGPAGEYKLRPTSDPAGYGTLLLPAGQAYELMGRYYHIPGNRHRLEGGGLFQLLPDGIVTPGIALGIWDLTGSSPFGRRAFLVVTKALETGHLGVTLPAYLQRVQLTLGAGTGRFSGPLAGLRLDLPAGVSLVAEYDARRFNAGLWFAPPGPVTLKAELQNNEPFLGGDLRIRF